MYTYVQRPGCKKENTATYVHTGGVSNAYSRIRTTRARVHGWVGTEKQRRRRVHGEAMECIVFMGRQRNASCSSGGLGRNRRWKRGLAYRRTEETALCSTGHVRNGILFSGRGLAVGERSNLKKFLRTRKIMVMHSNERGECCPRTLVDRKQKRYI